MRKTLALLFCASLVLLSPSVVGHAGSKGLPAPPAGFVVGAGAAQMWAQMREAGVADKVQASKQNAGWPNCFSDPKVSLEYGWQAVPGGNASLEMMAKAPEDPVSVTSGVRDEPAGKQRYKNGVLWWRKQTWPVIGGSCSQKEIVLWSGHWAGYTNDKIIGVSVSNLYGEKNIGQGWIDDYINQGASSVSGG